MFTQSYKKKKQKKNNCYPYFYILLKIKKTIAQSAETAPLQRGKTLPLNECPGYDTKQSDGEVPVMLGPWGIWSTPSLPLLQGPL